MGPPSLPQNADAEAEAGLEIELKLVLDPGSAPQLLEISALRAWLISPASRGTLRSVYYDTPDLGLHRANVTLRLREVDGAVVQTLKATRPGEAGLFDRPELEWPVAGPEPDLECIREADPAWAREALRGCEREALRPVVETEVQRTSVLLGWQGSEIELALDEGHVRAGGEQRPICELELELRSGRVAALYDVALALCDELPLRLATRSKSAVGFELLTGAAPVPRRSSTLEHAEDASLEGVIARVVDDCQRQIGANRELALTTDAPEAIHQMRVGARRLRSALSLFGKMLPDAERRALRDELRWLGQALGPARDFDVLLHERLAPLQAMHPDDGGLKRLCDECVAARSEAYANAREALASQRLSRLLLRIGRFVTARGWRDQPLSPAAASLFGPARPVARKLLRKRHRRALAAGGELSRMSAGELHALRIELKKLRYASEFLRTLFPEDSGKKKEEKKEEKKEKKGKMKKRNEKQEGKIAAKGDVTTKRLRRLQDLLGRLNDDEAAVRLLDGLLERMGGEGGPAQQRAAGFVTGWAAHARAQAFERLDRRFDQFAKERPFWS